MKKILSNLRIGTKLFLFSIIIIVTILSIGITSSLVLKKISVKENNIIQSISISDAIFEAKYFLRSDMQIFMEISKSTESEKLRYWQGEHDFQIIFFNDQIKKIQDNYIKNKQDDKYEFNIQVLSLVNSISKEYNDEFLSLFLKLKKLKDEEFALYEKQKNAEVNTRLAEIKSETSKYESIISEKGLKIIKSIDKAKVLTHNIVNSLQNEINEIITTSLRRTIIIGILALIIISIVTFYLNYLISAPVRNIKAKVEKMSLGEQPSDFVIKSKDEFGEIQTAINKLIASIKQITSFAKDIGKNNFMSKYSPASNDDELGNSLIEMRDSLKKAEDEQLEYDAEENKRKWTNKGLALFNDVLRQNDVNLNDLSADIITKLINYLKANQGGLFIINNDIEAEKYIELIASYAYSRRKYYEKKIDMGEGLIGTCAIEKKTIYLTDIPDDYIEITSGLGGANPNSIIIVPLKIDEDVLGVIEIASFKTFEKYEIEFIERIAETIAATLSSARINAQTAQLLEKTQQQAEEMSAQEEEMRQNMEELQATQEEADRKTSEMESFINALNLTTYIAEYDLEGRITYVNDSYLKLLDIKKNDVIGSHHSDNMVFTNEQKNNYNQFWNDLKSGKVKREKSKVNIKGKNYLFIESYSPIYNQESNIYKILKIANDISEYLDK